MEALAGWQRCLQGFIVGHLCPEPKSTASTLWRPLRECGGKLKPSRGNSGTHSAILPQGECRSFHVLLGQSSHTCYPKLELLGLGKTVLPEPNAEVPGLRLN